MNANRSKGRCPYCGKGLKHIGSSNIMDWGKRWNAVAVQFVCRDGHMVLLLPAGPVLEAEQAARAEEAERPYYGCIIGPEEELDPVAELLLPEWSGDSAAKPASEK